MSKVFYYKLTVDNGGAPCVQDRLLTLAICKPTIRRCAQRGDWVVGFGGKSFRVVNRGWPEGRAVPGKPLVFMARITSKQPDGTYYLDTSFSDRRDRIYERNGPRFQRRSDAMYHEEPERLQDDLGNYPAYEKSAVLLSDDFRYFPDGGTLDYEPKFPDIKDAFDRVHRIHGVAHSGTDLFREFMALQRWLWGQFADVATADDMSQPLGDSEASTSCGPTSAVGTRTRRRVAPRRDC